MINKIKEDLSKNIGSDICIIINGSRNKKEKCCGKIFEIYNNIFIIKLDTGEIKSVSYVDVLTNTVEIMYK